jgi:hypothetical protein
VGVVEYKAKTESTEHAVPPAGRHTVARYCGRSDRSKFSISAVNDPLVAMTLYFCTTKLGRSCRHASRRTAGVTSMIDNSVPPELATTIESP